MLASGRSVVLSGRAADLFDLHGIIYHASAGYVCAGVAILHFLLQPRRIVVYLRRLFGCRAEEVREEVNPRMDDASLRRCDAIMGAIYAIARFLGDRLIPEGYESFRQRLQKSALCITAGVRLAVLSICQFLAWARTRPSTRLASGPLAYRCPIRAGLTR